MTRMITDTWRRAWVDRTTRLIVEHDPCGRVFIAVDGKTPGFAASFNAAIAAEIAAYLRDPAANPDGVWRDGLSRLLIFHDSDGWAWIAVHDVDISPRGLIRENSGYTAYFNSATCLEIAAFINGDTTT